jgi:hypothetical protein
LQSQIDSFHTCKHNAICGQDTYCGTCIVDGLDGILHLMETACVSPRNDKLNVSDQKEQIWNGWITWCNEVNKQNMGRIFRWIVVSPSGENVVVELSYLRAMVGLKNVLLDSQSVSQSKRFVVFIGESWRWRFFGGRWLRLFWLLPSYPVAIWMRFRLEEGGVDLLAGGRSSYFTLDWWSWNCAKSMWRVVSQPIAIAFDVLWHQTVVCDRFFFCVA